MIGVSPLSSEVPFLIFNGGLLKPFLKLIVNNTTCTEIERSLEASITIALSKKDLKVSIMLGLQTVRYFLPG